MHTRGFYRFMIAHYRVGKLRVVFGNGANLVDLSRERESECFEVAVFL